nr:T9SS type A sorting domain-containing protein [Bacteroidota bacterium]
GSDMVTVNALDVRCGNKMNKVEYCHKGKNTICISPNAVPAHIAQGGYFGPCSTSGDVEEENNFTQTSTSVFNLYPNPTYNKATVEFTVDRNQEVTIAIYDSKGAFVKEVFKGMAIESLNHKVEINSGDIATGIYFVRMSNDTEVKHIKLVRTN